MQGKKMGADLSRKDFLKLGGAGLAGAALLGTAGCGGGSGGSGDLILSWGPDETGSLPKLVKQFNQQSKDFKVTYQEMPVDTGQYFDKLRTQFQAGGGDIDLILGDVIWPAQFAVNGWVSDLSDRFKDTDAFLPGPMQASTYDGKVWAVPWYTDAGSPLLQAGSPREIRLLGAPRDLDRAAGDGGQGNEGPGHRATASSSRVTSTRAGSATAASTSGPTAATSSTPKTRSKVIIDSPEAAAGLAI